MKRGKKTFGNPMYFTLCATFYKSQPTTSAVVVSM